MDALRVVGSDIRGGPAGQDQTANLRRSTKEGAVSERWRPSLMLPEFQVRQSRDLHLRTLREVLYSIVNEAVLVDESLGRSFKADAGFENGMGSGHETVQPNRWRVILRRLVERSVPWFAFGLLSAVFLRPILTAPIIGDDFLNPWAQFPTAGMSPGGLWRFAINRSQLAGHFNFLGQIIGTYLTALWTWMMAVLGIRYTAIYATTKLMVYLLSVVAIASFVRIAAEIAGRRISPWRSRIYVAIPLFGVLQIHSPWSHDPVSNYPLSGFATAAIGFAVFRLSIEAIRGLETRWSVAAGIAGLASILYYEINIACVVAVVPLVIWGWQYHGGGTRGIRKMAMPTVLTLFVPTIISGLLYLRAKPQTVNYGGTTFAAGSSALTTFRIAFLGTLPGAGWRQSREFLAEPIALRSAALAVLIIVATVLFSLASRRPYRGSIDDTSTSRLALISVCSAAGIYWVGAVLMQASTAKVQAENTRIGAVYNYYSVGTASIAALAAFVVLFWPRRLSIDVMRIGALTCVIVFIAVQYMVNWNISARFQGYALYNRDLNAAFSDKPRMEERCRVLTTWASVDWPEYLEVGMIDGLQSSYEYFHGEPFCAGFVRTP